MEEQDNQLATTVQKCIDLDRKCMYVLGQQVRLNDDSPPLHERASSAVSATVLLHALVRAWMRDHGARHMDDLSACDRALDDAMPRKGFNSVGSEKLCDAQVSQTVSIDPWYNNRWAQVDANDIHMFRVMWWVPRALHMASAIISAPSQRNNALAPQPSLQPHNVVRHEVVARGRDEVSPHTSCEMLSTGRHVPSPSPVRPTQKRV